MTEETLHVYTARVQRATHYIDDVLPNVRFRVRHKPRELLWCQKCRKRRWAKYLTVQVYYDATFFWCADGHGCSRKEK
jgi:hypothetical protein